MEIRWVIVFCCLIFAATFSLLYNSFTETLFGWLAYIPWLVSLSYTIGKEIGINTIESKKGDE